MAQIQIFIEENSGVATVSVTGAVDTRRILNIGERILRDELSKMLDNSLGMRITCLTCGRVDFYLTEYKVVCPNCKQPAVITFK
jgi:hypothetical protein